MLSKQSQYFWKIIIAFSVALFFLNSVIFILLGQTNADEGWYLYASKLVYTGQYPYRDFAFTQTPLLPYIYGLPQTLLFQSIYLGRITSAIFSMAAFVLAFIIAEKHGGKMASGITSLLGATFTYGIYFQSITKTYALTTLFFVLTIFIFSSNTRHGLRLILSTIFVLLAALTRLSAAFFAIPFIVYAFVVSNTKKKLITIALCLVASSWILILALQNIDAVAWGLLTHHISQWGNASINERVLQILGLRIPGLFKVFPAYFFLWITVILMEFNQIRNKLRHFSVVFVTTIGLLLFSISNLISGGFYIEYFTPFIFASFPIVGIVCAKIFFHKGKYSKILLDVVLLSTMVLGLIRGGYYFIDTSGGRAPVEEIKKASKIISDNSTVDDKILVLEALLLVIESHRQVMPNMTMAQFSVYNMDTKTVNELHLVNGQIVLNYINNSDPKIIVLTDLDWSILRNMAYYKSIVYSLQKNYQLIYSEDNFGQHSSHVDIYIQRKSK